MDANGKGVDGAGEAGEPPWEPTVLLRSLWEQLAAIPWISLGAIGTGVGVALLYFYFHSIDFIPADIPAILGASVVVAMLALAFYLWMLLSLIAPIWVFREAKLQPAQSESGKSLGMRWGLPALQFLGVGLFFLYLGLRSWQRCETIAPVFLATGGVPVLMGAAMWIWSEINTAGQRPAWWCRLPGVIGVCGMSMLPVVAFLLGLKPSAVADGWGLAIMVFLWLVVVFGTAFGRIPVWGYAFLLTLAAPILLFSMPTLMGHSNHFPATVAELAGVRARTVEELRVPRSTCRLIESALASRLAAKPVSCDGAEWGTAHAHVLSSFGPRWLIEIQVQPPVGSNRQDSLRLTIPGDGVHTVRFMPPPKSTSCGA